MTKKPDFKALANRAAKRTDQTKTTAGAEFAPPKAGTTGARLIGYVEVGMQKQKPYQGKAKAPAPKVYITFELLGKDYVREIESNGVTRTVADQITIPLTLSTHEKSSFTKLFKKMLYGRDGITHMSQMLGEAFRVTVTHNKSGEGSNQKVYANLTDDEGTFLVGAPKIPQFDDDGNLVGTKNMKVIDSVSPERMFIWDEPTQECWDSLFIDGQKEVKDEKGKTKTVSKNWLQNMITSAVDFEGSPIQAFLEGSDALPDNPDDLEDEEEELEDEDDSDAEEDEDLDEDDSDEESDEEEEEVEDEEEEEETPPPAPKKSAKPVAKKKPASSASTVSKPAKTTKKSDKVDDALAAMGLV